MNRPSVYAAYHLCVSEDGKYEITRVIGVFSSSEVAEAAISRFRRRSGFAEPKNSFETVVYEFNVKKINVYSTKEGTEAVVCDIHHGPGSAEPEHSFEIVPYELDKDDWTEGYFTWGPEIE